MANNPATKGVPATTTKTVRDAEIPSINRKPRRSNPRIPVMSPLAWRRLIGTRKAVVMGRKKSVPPTALANRLA